MGRVFDFAKKDVSLFNGDPAKGPVGFFDLPPSQVSQVTSALISPGKTSVNQAVAQMSGNQLNALALKADAIWRSDVSNPLADLIGEEFGSIVTLVRIMAQAAQGSSEFAGILAAGQQLDIWPLRAKDIGGVFLNGAGTANLGLYGGVSANVFSWRRAVVAGVAQTIIPTQTTSGQSPYGGLVILGAIEKTFTPKIESISLVLQGQPAGTVPPQPASMTMKRTFGENNDISLVRFEKPVIITQNESWGMQIMPNESGTTNFELVAVMCGQVQSKVF
jgi:hypothetical protein